MAESLRFQKKFTFNPLKPMWKAKTQAGGGLDKIYVIKKHLTKYHENRI